VIEASVVGLEVVEGRTSQQGLVQGTQVEVQLLRGATYPPKGLMVEKFSHLNAHHSAPGHSVAENQLPPPIKLKILKILKLEYVFRLVFIHIENSIAADASLI